MQGITEFYGQSRKEETQYESLLILFYSMLCYALLCFVDILVAVMEVYIGSFYSFLISHIIKIIVTSFVCC